MTQYESSPVLSDLEYESWAESQQWYQAIELRNGYVTKGNDFEGLRGEFLSGIDYKGKRVLDVGCNSGKYALAAKAAGAAEVIGVDVNKNRLEQARMIAMNESLDVTFLNKGIEGIAELGQFDIVICIAVLTEVENVIGGLRALASCLKGKAVIEMGLAQSVLSISKNRSWWRADTDVSRLGRTGEFQRHTHAGWVVYPSLEIVCDIFGREFKVTYLGHGPRYELLEIDYAS